MPERRRFWGTRNLLIGIDYYEVKLAKECFKWAFAIFHENCASCYQNLSEKGYTLYTLEPGKEKTFLKMPLVMKSGFVFGYEEFGISFDPSVYNAIQRLSIQEYGRAGSLNVSVAASVVMSDYLKQHSEDLSGL